MEIEEQSKNKTLETDSKTEGKMRIQKFRDFKIYGTVGGGGWGGGSKQKDKLSCMGLLYKIQNGKKEGCSGEEIFAASQSW